MAHSELQKLQKNRAWFKFMITGLSKPINLNYLTSAEKDMWKEILEIRRNLINIHDDNSRALGLDVPRVRCTFCSKEAKYSFERQMYCKKHFKEYQDEAK